MGRANAQKHLAQKPLGMLISGSVSGRGDLWLTPKAEELFRVQVWLVRLPPSRSVPPFMLFGGQPPPHEAGQNSPFHMDPRECCFPTEEGSPPLYFSTGNVCHTPSSTCCIMTYFPKKELTLLASEVPFRKPSHVEECISIFSNM